MSNIKSVIDRDVHRSRQKLKCIFNTLQIIANEKVYFDKIYKRQSCLLSDKTTKNYAMNFSHFG